MKNQIKKIPITNKKFLTNKYHVNYFEKFVNFLNYILKTNKMKVIMIIMLSDIFQAMTHCLLLIGDGSPDFTPITTEIISAANKILTTLFVIFGIGVGWWSIINLLKIAKDRNDVEARAAHIQGLQYMYGAFIASPLVITIVNLLIKALVLPNINVG